MHPTLAKLAGGGGKIPGNYVGTWGAFGGPKQKGITQYAVAANRQKPLAGALHNAIFNTFRRVRGQIFYVVPPFVAVYYIIQWAEESKQGRAMYGDSEE